MWGIYLSPYMNVVDFSAQNFTNFELTWWMWSMSKVFSVTVMNFCDIYIWTQWVYETSSIWRISHEILHIIDLSLFLCVANSFYVKNVLAFSFFVNWGFFFFVELWQLKPMKLNETRWLVCESETGVRRGSKGGSRLTPHLGPGPTWDPPEGLYCGRRPVAVVLGQPCLCFPGTQHSLVSPQFYFSFSVFKQQLFLVIWYTWLVFYIVNWKMDI